MANTDQPELRLRTPAAFEKFITGVSFHHRASPSGNYAPRPPKAGGKDSRTSEGRAAIEVPGISIGPALVRKYAPVFKAASLDRAQRM